MGLAVAHRLNIVLTMPHNRTVALRTRRLALLLAAASLLITQSVTSAAHDDDEFVWPPDDLVVPLDLKNFDSLVGNGSAWVVEFYAPWYAPRAVVFCVPPSFRFTLPCFLVDRLPR